MSREIKDVDYYPFTIMIPIYKIKPPEDFYEYYQIHKDEIIVEQSKKIDRLNNEIVELNIKLEDRAFEQLKTKINMQKEENKRLNLHIMAIKEAISTWNLEYEEGKTDFKIPKKIKDIVWGDKE